MSVRQSFKIAIPLILCWILAGCTSNPFGESEIATPNLEIHGRVSLNTSDSPENVYIWFEGLNLAKRPDENGNFTFRLPPPSAQGLHGGLQGSFDIYFYIANFNLVSRTIVLRNGEILFSQGDLTEEGDLFPEIFLAEQLKVNTKVKPGIVNWQEDTLRFNAEVTLRTEKDTVDILFPHLVGRKEAPLMIKEAGNAEVEIVETLIVKGVTDDFLRVTTSPLTREFFVEVDSDNFPIGDYEIVPYILVVNQGVPRALVQSIAPDVEDLGPTYLRLPFIRRGGKFEIVEQTKDDW
ncbi:hypothetical protein GWO43_18095 [candidate division KSB1 bacterium]|nr:hypothetical protein [candidate division KSB1 bacterium]NIR69971.1 hypothetical protein [candidate division KSB1 bacterium]NIS25870.1 hypothetical protein [candidate division KSB1 bacterium]NIT72747.1 hypothetical protein [candidate division KSB1 bacterium]NIU26559.1 hypothetical protein [candidate division KSB1 bacterium]